MLNKNSLRKKFLILRKKRYFEIKPEFFNPIINLITKKKKGKTIYLSSYYPSNFEVNVLKIFELNLSKKIKILLPVIKGNKSMYFYPWKNKDILQINKFGMLEPALLSKHKIPDIMLIPLLAFDNFNNRLGYGGGYYDRYLNKFLKKNSNIITVGIAFSFQRYHKLPINAEDIKLKYILTEKGFLR